MMEQLGIAVAGAVVGSLFGSWIAFMFGLKRFRIETKESFLHAQRGSAYQEILKALAGAEEACNTLSALSPDDGIDKQPLVDAANEGIATYKRTLAEKEFLIEPQLLETLKELDHALSIVFSLTGEIVSGKVRNERTLENFYKIIDEWKARIPPLKDQVKRRIKSWLGIDNENGRSV
ncbi:hypothetical protein IIA79_05640 [bacterium]|nr:hypothetical protein [bacterium]